MTPQQRLVRDAYEMIRLVPVTGFRDSELDILPDRYNHVGELDHFLRQFYTFLLIISDMTHHGELSELTEANDKLGILYKQFVREIRRRFPVIPERVEVLICRNFSVAWIRPENMWTGEILAVTLLNGDYRVAPVGLKKPSPPSEEGDTA